MGWKTGKAGMCIRVWVCVSLCFTVVMCGCQWVGVFASQYVNVSVCVRVPDLVCGFECVCLRVRVPARTHVSGCFESRPLGEVLVLQAE